jgi:hypothetical protein
MLSKNGKTLRIIGFCMKLHKTFDLYNEREVEPGLKTKKRDIA